MWITRGVVTMGTRFLSSKYSVNLYCGVILNTVRLTILSKYTSFYM